MRLWHKDLIPVLPRQQLLAQWRECCCIAKNLAENGTPNHLLVNRVLEYPPIHFESYCDRICAEMIKRNYNISSDSYTSMCQNIQKAEEKDIFKRTYIGALYQDWHNDRYFWQCYYNLQEKYDCGGIPEDEWKRIRLLATHKEVKLRACL